MDTRLKEMTTKDIQTVSLEILDDVHQFCLKNNIMYSIAYGTLIGAVRHKGFIPWDDDVDILMPRPDWERFCATYQSSLKFRLVVPGDDSMIAMARLCEMEKTIVKTDIIPWCKQETGVWIDLFPLDGAEDDIDEFRKRVKKICYNWRWNFLVRSSMSPFSRKKGLGKNAKLLLKKLTLFMLHPWKEHDRLLRKQEYGKYNHVSNLAAPEYKDKEYFLLEDFNSYVKLPFEGKEFMAMSGYDRVLRTIYGDYMQLPPEEKRVAKHPFHEYYWK